MQVKAQQTFYILSGFLLMTALFVLQPSAIVARPFMDADKSAGYRESDPVTVFRESIIHQFSVAWQQTIGDQPYFDDVAAVFDGIAAFYNLSSQETIALLSSPDTDQDIYFVFSTTYKIFANALRQEQPKIAGVQIDQTTIIPVNFMTEPAIDNIVPEDTNHVSRSTYQGSAIAGTVYQAWNDIQDASTGQIYCLAIYYGEVNKYLGPCKFDYH